MPSPDSGHLVIANKYGRDVAEALQSLVRYCDEAALIVDRGRQAYDKDVLLHRACEAVFNRIGETIRAKLPAALLDAYPDQPWSQIVGMRVRMAHLYTENDTALMWNTLVNDVPKLRGYIAHKILRQA